MTVTIIKRNQIIIIRKVSLKGITPVVNEYLYSMIPFYYRSEKARVEVDRILDHLGVDFITFVRGTKV